jgi:hypothetical protein
MAGFMFRLDQKLDQADLKKRQDTIEVPIEVPLF